MTTLEILIEVYALHDVDNVMHDKTIIESAFGRTLAELDAEDEFSSTRDFVAGLKRRIEDRKRDWLVPDRRTQIGACLRLVWDIALADSCPKSLCHKRMDVTTALFVRMFHGHWTKGQVAHVTFVVDMLKGWNTYFISYTNRSPKLTNNVYKKVITTFVEPTLLKSRSWDSDNLLADAIVASLRRENLFHGFYDKINIQVSDDLEQKIGPAAGSSFMFVQLVQRDTFTTAPPPPNWCFEEYKIFQRLGERTLKSNEPYREVFRKRFAPLIADDKVPAAWPFDYEPWMARVYKEQRHEMLPVDPQGFDNVVHKLALEIVSLHGQVMDCVPV